MTSDDLTKIGIACGDIADALYPNMADRPLRQKLALALVDLSRQVARHAESAVAAIEPRVAVLEEHCHERADIAAVAIAAIRDALSKNQLRLRR